MKVINLRFAIALLYFFTNASNIYAVETPVTDALLKHIAKPARTLQDQSSFAQAVESLPANTKEGAGFWIRISNDTHYSILQRRRCILEFFRRFVKLGTSVEDLRKLIGNSKWLSTKHLIVMTDITGSVPVSVVSNDTVVCLEVLPANKDTYPAVYLRIHGLISQPQLNNCLQGSYLNATCKMRIVEVGYYEPANR